MDKLIVIGIDGATWDLIKPWAEEGHLPNFKKILEQGTHGILMSTNPPLTSPGWPAFFTGKNPGKHGVYDFIEPHGERISNGKLVRAKALWEILSDNGKKSIVQNVPLTFPPRKIDGVMITDMMAAPGAIFTHPADLTQRLNDAGYKIDVLFDRPKEKPKKEVIKLINQIERDHFKVFSVLLDENEWDFAMLAITGTDRLQHYYWDDKDVLRDHYELVDEIIGQLFTKYGETVNFALLSDHGFCEKTIQLDLNLWLEQQGYLSWEDSAASDGQKESWMDQTYYKKKKGGVKSLLKKVGITHEIIQSNPILKKASKKIPKHIRKKLGSNLEQTRRVQNWGKTKAFIPTGIVRGININLEGREKNGSVSKADYEQVRNDLIAKLAEIKTPDNRMVFSRVLKREEVYTGPYIDEAFDILFELESDHVLPVAKKNRQLFTKSDHAGYHHEDGMYALIGPDFTSDHNVPAVLEDLAPTMLHAYGLAVPKDMDGEVLIHALQNQTEIVYSDRPEKSVETEKSSISAAIKNIKF